MEAIFAATGKHDLHVVGIYDSKGWIADDFVLSLEAQNAFAGPQLITSGLVSIVDGADKSAVQDAIAAALALGLCVAASGAYAQDTGTMAPAPASTSMGHMNSGMSHDKMMNHKMMDHKMNASMHKMPATVKSVDASTGIVGVEAGGMALTVHFPPKSMANLKVGDKITLHMGFSQR